MTGGWIETSDDVDQQDEDTVLWLMMMHGVCKGGDQGRGWEENIDVVIDNLDDQFLT